MRFYDLPDTLVAEQNQFEDDVKRFSRGEINPVKFKAIRVAHGVYEQRQEHTYMIRIRCAAAGITPAQLKRVAELGTEYGNGEVHFTTRQEVQVHDVLLQNVLHVIRGLHEVGLSTRGGGGNTIRNILNPPLSGVEKDEVFDVSPYSMALTTRMIHEPDSWNLPRKFKIAFSNTAEDTAYTQATCLGFVAKIKDGQKGFEVYTSGGMGAKPMVGYQLFDFIPDTQVYHVTRAIKTMFDKHGNRRSKYSNRIKFLWKKLGREEFTSLFLEDYNAIKDDASLNLVLPKIKDEATDCNLPVESVDSAEFFLWKKRYVVEQKQAGLVSIKIPLCLGDLEKADADALCNFLQHFGDNTIRCGRAQNIYLRNIPAQYIGNAYNVITGLSHSLVEHASFIGDMINCTGAQTCKLGICLPRGLSLALHDKLTQSDLNLDAIPDFKLNMSGCPNTCGMHHVADLGFFGKIGRKDGNIYPAYNVLAGAKRGAGKTEYAVRQGDIPAHAVPEFVYQFLKHYIEEKDEFETYHDFLEAEGIDLIKRLCEDLKSVPSLEEDKSFYIDFGAKRPLRLDDMGTAECSAGMFDMINVDKKEIEKHLKALDETGTDKASTLQTMLFHVSRMLLVTRGLDANNKSQAFELFAKHFIQTELVSIDYLDLINAAKAENADSLVANEEKAIACAKEVLELYKNMDDSLRFKAKEEATATSAEQSSTDAVKKDYRGVACPMNFVKTKLVLETMTSGAELEILLDDGEPINNVPNSVKLEGHKVLAQERVENYWKVRIQKK